MQKMFSHAVVMPLIKIHNVSYLFRAWFISYKKRKLVFVEMTAFWNRKSLINYEGPSQWHDMNIQQNVFLSGTQKQLNTWYSSNLSMLTVKKILKLQFQLQDIRKRPLPYSE